MEFLKGLFAALSSEELRNAAVVVGVIVAIASVFTAREMARKKQTADLLFGARNDKELQNGQTVILKYHDGNDKNIRTLAEPENFNDPDAAAARYVLNHFEVVSIGVQAGIYDEDMLKRSWCNLLTTTYDRTEQLIKAVREKKKSPTALQEFQWLALRWKAAPLRKRTIIRSD